MKKLLLISFALVALLAPVVAHAVPRTPPKAYTVLLAGGEEANAIKVWLSSDGRHYVIDSVVELEVGGNLCVHPEENPYELVCDAPSIAGFEVNSGAGDDRVAVARGVAVPVTMRGGAGDDLLIGGLAADRLIGGTGNDRLVGWRGSDQLYGGPGDDVLIGGPGGDILRGGPGRDRLLPGHGRNRIHQR